jgi:hypothetical protein
LGQINLLATQTQVAAQTSAAAQSQQLVTIPAQSGSPTAAPTLDLLKRAGPFRQVSLEEALIAGRVTALIPAADGSILLLSDKGYSRFTAEGWAGYFTDEVGYLAGVDPAGRAWVITRDGSQIAVWEDDQWRYHGAEAGWTPVNITGGGLAASGLVEGDDSDLWLSTGADIRRFDGATWQVFSPELMGMPAVEDPSVTTNYSVFHSPMTGDLLVGRCDWGTAGPQGGGGVRKFSQGAWQEMDTLLSSGCMASVHEDGLGNVWIGLDGNLFRMPAGGVTETVALPEPPQGSTFGSVNSISSGLGGDLWISPSLCSESGCYGEQVLYRFASGEWQQIGEPRQAGGQSLLFDSSGKPWLFSSGTVYQIENQSLIPVNGLVVLAAARSASGEIWLVAQSTGPPTLWKLES